MKIPEHIQKLYKEVISDIGTKVPITIPKELKVSNGINFYGKCRRYRDNTYVIYLSKYLFNCSNKQIKDVIAHELVHTCKDCNNHGTLFKHYCNFLYTLGYNICGDEIYEAFELDRMKAYKYKITCKECGKTYLYAKKINISKYSCGKCKGKLQLEEL